MKTPTISVEPALPKITNGMSDSEKKEIIVACYADPIIFLETFLEDWFPSPIPWFHRGTLSILLKKVNFLSKYGEIDKIIENFTFRQDPTDEDSPQLPLFHQDGDRVFMRATLFLLLMFPRGFAKTTLVNAALLYSILYEAVKFSFLLSESATHSETQLNNVKRQLEQNEKLRIVYGDLVPGRQDSAKWTSSQVETKNKITCFAKGRGGQVRGANVDAKRPDLIIIDDVEDQESVMNVDQREKTRKWFWEAVLPALPAANKEARIVMACTLLHREALASVLLNDPDWTTIVFGAYDKNGEALWPACMDEEALRRKRDSFARMGNLAGYYREYHNTLRHEDSQIFKPEYIRFEHHTRSEFIATSMALDPAISQNKNADFCSIAVVGLLESGEMCVVESHSEIGMPPHEQISKFFELYLLWRPQVCGIESIAFQQALIFLMKEEMARRSVFFEIKPITHGRLDKLTRVEGVLQPRYASGFVSHRRSFPVLEQQLFDWPSGKRDAPDALAMAVTLLEPLNAISFDSSTFVEELYQRPTAGSGTMSIEGAP